MKETFCPLPWVHLATHPTGHVTLCCNSDHTGLNDAARNFIDDTKQYTMLGKSSINDIMNSDYYKQVRLQFLNNEIPLACRQCFEKEAVGNSSKRLDSRQEFSFSLTDAKRITNDTGEILPQLDFVELRLGNLCNMKCVTCNPASSDKWTDDYQQLANDLPFVLNFNVNNTDLSWSQNSIVWDDLIQYATSIKKVYINGGEPLLNKNHFDFLNILNKDTVVMYNTNLSVINNKMLDAWKKFNYIHLNVSIDDLFERNDYIRYGSAWDTTIKNLKTLSSYDFIKINITQTISVLNIYYITEFKEYFNEYSSHFNFVSEPRYLDVKFLPSTVIDKLNMKYKDKWFYSEIKNYLNISTDIPEDTKINTLQQGLTYIKYLDTLRNTSFQHTFNNWYTILHE